MIDSSKRRSLKSITAIAAAPFVPLTAMSGVSFASDKGTQENAKNIINDAGLEIRLELGDEPHMRVTNATDRLTILRQINPGVVHVGDTTYHLNHALLGSAYAIGAGGSRLLPISKTIDSSETAAVNSRKPLRLATLTANTQSGRQLQASRVFFA